MALTKYSNVGWRVEPQFTNSMSDYCEVNCYKYTLAYSDAEFCTF